MTIGPEMGPIPICPTGTLDSCPMCHKPFQEKKEKPDMMLLTDDERELIMALKMAVQTKRAFLYSVSDILK